MISLTRISLVAFLLISICLLSYSCDEPCKFDNSSFWTPQDHGVYNCIDEDNECKALRMVQSGKAQAGLKFPDLETWTTIKMIQTNTNVDVSNTLVT